MGKLYFSSDSTIVKVAVTSSNPLRTSKGPIIAISALHQSQIYRDFLARDYLYKRDVLANFLDVVTDLSQSEIGYLHLVDEARQEIELAVWSGRVFEQCTTAYASHYPVSDAGIWAESIRQRRPVVHNDYTGMPSDLKNGLPEGHFPVTRHLGMPVMPADKVVAVLGVGNRSTPYSEAEIGELSHFINSAWSAVGLKVNDIEQRELDRLLKYNAIQPEATLLKVIAAMSDALELRDEYTSAHQRNVSLISHKIASVLDLNERQVEGVTLGALVHDIGKIGIPAEILNKMKPLNGAEYQLIKEHPTDGANLFKNIDLPIPLAQMIEQHHERLDGSGYPNRLKGNDICIEARIIAVADTFDAMASDRPYRYSPGRQAAIDELRSNRNIKYDAYVVDRFLELLDTDRDLKPGALYK